MNVFNLPFKFRLHRIRILFVTTTFVFAMVIFLPLFRKSSIPSTRAHHPSLKKTLRFKYVTHLGNSSVACRLAQLDPFHESILQYIEDLGKLQCEGESFSSFHNNVLRVEGEGIVSAQYRIIGRPPGDDFNILRSEPVPIPNIADNSAENAVQYEQHSRGTISSVSCHGFNIIYINVYGWVFLFTQDTVPYNSERISKLMLFLLKYNDLECFFSSAFDRHFFGWEDI